MKHVLVIYYSQSGQVRKALDWLTQPLTTAHHVDLRFVEIRPQVAYPFPWRRITRFFGVMPETVLGQPGPNLPLQFSTEAEARPVDLVVLAYPVWFLMPAPPVQRFLNEEAAGVVSQAHLLALCVCRGMWYHAALNVGRSLAKLTRNGWSQVVVRHHGPQWATFLSVPRKMLFGSERRSLIGLPPPEIASDDLTRLARIGEALRTFLEDAKADMPLSLSDAAPPSHQRAAIIPELCAWPFFWTSARILRWLGRHGRPLQQPAIILFAALLVLLILLVWPFLGIASGLWYALCPGWFAHRTRKATVGT